MPGELAQYVRRVPRLATYTFATETFTYESSIVYLGDTIDDTVSPDAALARALDGTCVVDGARHIYREMVTVLDTVSALPRGDLLVTSSAHARAKLEYPPGVCGGISKELSGDDAFQLSVLRLVCGPCSTHTPGDVIRTALGGVLSYSSRRDILRCGFALALAAVTVDGPRADLLDLFHSSTDRQFRRVSISHALVGSLNSLDLEWPSAFTVKTEWRRLVKRGAEQRELVRRDA